MKFSNLRGVRRSEEDRLHSKWEDVVLESCKRNCTKDLSDDLSIMESPTPNVFFQAFKSIKNPTKWCLHYLSMTIRLLKCGGSTLLILAPTNLNNFRYVNDIDIRLILMGQLLTNINNPWVSAAFQTVTFLRITTLFVCKCSISCTPWWL